MRQTQFLVAAFRRFERLSQETEGVDEHLLRQRLLSASPSRPWRHVVVAVGDRASDAHGLFPADWDLLARIHGLERLEVVVTDTVLAGAFHERIHQMLPGIEEVRADPKESRPLPVLITPSGGALVHTARDREEEVAGFARWVRREARDAGSDSAGRTPSAAVCLPRAFGPCVCRHSVADVRRSSARGRTFCGGAGSGLRLRHQQLRPRSRRSRCCDRHTSELGSDDGEAMRVISSTRPCAERSGLPRRRRRARTSGCRLGRERIRCRPAGGRAEIRPSSPRGCPANLRRSALAAPCAEQLDRLLGFLSAHERLPVDGRSTATPADARPRRPF